MRAILASVLLLASAAAPAQPIDRDEFASGLLRVVEASKDEFRSVRGEVYTSDDKGSPERWGLTVAIRGTRHNVVHKDFVAIGIGSFRDTEQARKIYRETVGLIRASLPQAQWQSTADSIEPTRTGGEQGTAHFERGKNANPVVSLSYWAAPSGSGRVTLWVRNHSGRAPVQD